MTEPDALPFLDCHTRLTEINRMNSVDLPVLLNDTDSNIRLAAIFRLVALKMPAAEDLLLAMLQKPLLPASPRSDSDHQNTILLVDDEKPPLAGIQDILELVDYSEIVTAYDGVEAVEQANMHRPALILMNWMMPRMNGLQAARQIKTKMPETLIILHSAGVEHGKNVPHVLCSGIATAFNLPYDAEDLLRLVTAALAFPDIFSEIIVRCAARHALRCFQLNESFYRFIDVIMSADILDLLRQPGVREHLHRVSQMETCPNARTAALHLLNGTIA